MWLTEEMTETHPLFPKVQYVTVQSCERNQAEIHYRNVNRKFIPFDLRDCRLMVLVGLTLKPFGFFQHLQNYLADSRFRFFKVWAETAIAKRGEASLRHLYLTHPEKFFEVEFENAKSTRMKLIKCNFIISEVVEVKCLAMKDREQSPEQMQAFRETIQRQEKQFFLNDQLASEFNPKKENSQKLLGNKLEK